jgi:hypothetical protein
MQSLAVRMIELSLCQVIAEFPAKEISACDKDFHVRKKKEP